MKTCLTMSLILGLAASALGAERSTEIVVVTPAGTQHEMLLVPAGECQIGHGVRTGNHLASQVVYLPNFYIDKYEVANGRYRAFLQATGKQPPEEWEYYREVAQPDSDQYPAIAIQWPDAVEYCQWAGLRLPTGLEWEKAARGEDGRTYPWGEEADNTRANHGGDINDVCCGPDIADGYLYTAPVGSYPAGASPYGALDMAGNLGEWTTDLPLVESPRKQRIIRGGAYFPHFAGRGFWQFRDATSCTSEALICGKCRVAGLPGEPLSACGGEALPDGDDCRSSRDIAQPARW